MFLYILSYTCIFFTYFLHHSAHSPSNRQIIPYSLLQKRNIIGRQFPIIMNFVSKRSDGGRLLGCRGLHRFLGKNVIAVWHIQAGGTTDNLSLCAQI